MKLLIGVLSVTAVLAAAGNDGDWPVYGHDPGGAKYSPLAQINRQNVKRLEVAWTFHTGDMYDPHGKGGKSPPSNPRRCSSMAFYTSPLPSGV